jgi:hypothetical protein
VYDVVDADGVPLPHNGDVPPDVFIGVAVMHVFAAAAKSRSQPSEASELQSANPALHEAIAHEPDEQTPAACARPLHEFEHDPQCAGSVCSDTSQPLAT